MTSGTTNTTNLVNKVKDEWIKMTNSVNKVKEEWNDQHKQLSQRRMDQPTQSTQSTSQK